MSTCFILLGVEHREVQQLSVCSQDVYHGAIRIPVQQGRCSGYVSVMLGSFATVNIVYMKCNHAVRHPQSLLQRHGMCTTQLRASTDPPNALLGTAAQPHLSCCFECVLITVVVGPRPLSTVLTAWPVVRRELSLCTPRSPQRAMT